MGHLDELSRFRGLQTGPAHANLENDVHFESIKTTSMEYLGFAAVFAQDQPRERDRRVELRPKAK